MSMMVETRKNVGKSYTIGRLQCDQVVEAKNHPYLSQSGPCGAISKSYSIWAQFSKIFSPRSLKSRPNN